MNFLRQNLTITITTTFRVKCCSDNLSEIEKNLIQVSDEWHEKNKGIGGTLKVAVIVMVTKWPQKNYVFEDRMNF